MHFFLPTPPPPHSPHDFWDFLEAWTTKLNWSHAAEFRAASDEDWKLDGRTAALAMGSCRGGWWWLGWDGVGWTVGGGTVDGSEIPRPTTVLDVFETL